MDEGADVPHSPSKFPTSLSSLHFSQNPNFSSTLASLKRSTLSPHNRLHSIQHDSLFVQSAALAHGLPLIANERCGSWYIPREQKKGSAYFKSTDGHFGEWAFSTRRLNLQMLELMGAAGGCVIVDSTRRGKSMPDALSKTVPIWCCVLNRLLFEEGSGSRGLYTPRGSVSASEYAQIEERIDGFVQDAKRLELDIVSLRATVQRPMVPSWITPEMEDHTGEWPLGACNRVICCTASRRVEGTEMSEDGYIQGAADDHEGWSQGLTAELWWQHREELLQVSEEDYPALVRQLIHSGKTSDCTVNHAIRILPTNIYIGTLSEAKQPERIYDAIITIFSDCLPSERIPGLQDEKRPLTLHIPARPGKLGSRALRLHLSRVVDFLRPLFASHASPRILIACPTGTDLSVGVALTVLCSFPNDNGNPRPVSQAPPIDKPLIRRHLAKITAAKADANPSRSTLQSVHAFLMP